MKTAKEIIEDYNKFLADEGIDKPVLLFPSDLEFDIDETLNTEQPKIKFGSFLRYMVFKLVSNRK